MTEEQSQAGEQGKQPGSSREKLFQFIFNRVPVAIGICDPKGTLLLANTFMEELTGCSKAELGSLDLVELFADQRDRKWMLQCLETEGMVRNHFIEVKKKDGTILPVVLNIDMVSMGGKKRYLIAGNNFDMGQDDF